MMIVRSLLLSLLQRSSTSNSNTISNSITSISTNTSTSNSKVVVLSNNLWMNLQHKYYNYYDYFMMNWYSPSSLSPQLDLVSFPNNNVNNNNNNDDNDNNNNNWIWFAVPKRKVTKGKKRMKTTIQKQIKIKNHIIQDSRTGQMTLRHRLPFNWKDYLQE